MDVILSKATIVLTGPITFLLKIIFGAVAYITFCIISLVAIGFSELLQTDKSLESLFGFNYTLFYFPITSISACILACLIFLDIAKSWSDIEEVETKGMGEYFKRILIAYILLAALPIVVPIFQACSAYFCDFCQKIFEDIIKEAAGASDESNVFEAVLMSGKQVYGKLSQWDDSVMEEILRAIMLLIFLIAFICGFIMIGVSLLKRYVEVLIAVLFIPVIAMSVYSNFDKLNAWLLNIAKIFIGYMLNIFLVYVMLLVSVKILNDDLTMLFVHFLLFIAIISVAMNSPQTIKEYLISTGTGQQVSGVARSAISAARYSRYIK